MPGIAAKQFIGALPVQYDFRAVLGSQFESEVLARHRYAGNRFSSWVRLTRSILAFSQAGVSSTV